MPTVVDALVVQLGLDATQFRRGQRETIESFRKTREGTVKEAKGIEQAAESAAESIARLGRNALRLFAIFTAGKSLGQFAADIARSDAAMGRLTKSIGQTPELVTAVGNAVARAGGSADGAARSFEVWSDHIERVRTTGVSPLLETLARLQAAGGKQINYNKTWIDQWSDLADMFEAVKNKSGIATATLHGKDLGFDPGLVALLVQGSAAFRKAVAESEKLNISTRKDTEAAQALQTAYVALTQEVEAFGRAILTAVSPALVRILKDIQAIVRAIREWVNGNVVPYLRSFAESMGIAGSETNTLLKACEALFALWAGAKFIAFLRAILSLRALLLGGRTGGAVAAGGGLLGLILNGLGIGAGVAAWGTTQQLPGAVARGGVDPATGGALDGNPTGGLVDRDASGRSGFRRWWDRTMPRWLGGNRGGGEAPAGSGRVGALPITPGTGEGHVASREERANYIRQAAIRNGIDPEVALRVAQSEGFDKYTGDQGRSFGDWQLFTGGGLGNEAEKAGINVRDPNTWKEQTDFALRKAREGGWGPWNGAKRVGIGNWQGIGRGGDAGTSGNVTPGSANHMQGQYGPAGSNLTTITTASGRKVTVHAAAAASFKGFLDELEGTGYRIDSLGGHNHRTIRGSNRLSQHAYGNAIDINPDRNPMGNRLITDLPPNVSAMAARHGLSWGGDWKRRPDAMHFEWTGRAPKKEAPAAPAPEPPTSARWWRGSPGAMAYADQARQAQAAQMARISNDNRSSSSTSSTNFHGGITVHTAATDADSIARDLEPAIKRRSYAFNAQSGPA